MYAKAALYTTDPFPYPSTNEHRTELKQAGTMVGWTTASSLAAAGEATTPQKQMKQKQKRKRNPAAPYGGRPQRRDTATLVTVPSVLDKTYGEDLKLVFRSKKDRYM